MNREKELIGILKGISYGLNSWGEDVMADEVLEAAKLLESTQWISVEDRLPPEATGDGDEELYLVWEGDDHKLAYYCRVGWDCPDEGWLDDVTHWMPLPKAPNAER